MPSPSLSTCLLIAAGALPLVWMAWPQPACTEEETRSADDARDCATHPATPVLALPAGVSSLSTLRLEPGAVIDDVRSGLDPYLGGLIQGTGFAEVWALDSIDVEAEAEGQPTVIIGHARPGWSGGVALAKGSFVTGSIEPKAPRFEWPALPTWDSTALQDESWDQQTRTWQGGDKHVREVLMLGSAELHLVGPLTLWVDRFLCEDQGQVHLDTRQGPIRIHIRQGWSMGTETRWNTQHAQTNQVAVLVGHGQPRVEEHINDPKSADERRARELRERLMGSEKENLNVPVRLEGQGEFRGLLYAPFTQLTLAANLPLRGALTARSITLREGARVTTDEIALQAWTPGE